MNKSLICQEVTFIGRTGNRCAASFANAPARRITLETYKDIYEAAIEHQQVLAVYGGGPFDHGRELVILAPGNELGELVPPPVRARTVPATLINGRFRATYAQGGLR